MISKRKLRRNGYKRKKMLQELDQVVLKRIKKSYNFSISTWGGTRCPGCGMHVRPAYLDNYDAHFYDPETKKWCGHMHGVINACESKYFKSKCPGEKEWF